MKYCKQQESLMDTRVRDMVQITKMVLDAMKAPANNTVLAPANPVGATNVNAVNTNAVGGVMNTNAVGGVNANAVGGVVNGLNTNTANINGMGATATSSSHSILPTSRRVPTRALSAPPPWTLCSSACAR